MANCALNAFILLKPLSFSINDKLKLLLMFWNVAVQYFTRQVFD